MHTSFLRTLFAGLTVGGAFLPFTGLAQDGIEFADGSARVDAFQKIAPTVDILYRPVDTRTLPRPLELRADLGLVVARPLTGQIVHTSLTRVFEPRCDIAPNGDYLLMFPDGGHYGTARTKINDLVAYRSSDQGRTWMGPTVPIRIDYNLHGFIPLVPHGTHRLYCFGTQPLLNLYHPEDPKQRENAPIGYRYSDDSGFTWSPVHLIRPVNDPEFRGMSVVRMCETGSGVWLLGSHVADRDHSRLATWQYILRSADQGKTWEVLPGARPSGWQCPGFGRMDETSLVCLGGDEVFALSRTPEGHLWALRSHDSGKTWEGPFPTPLVHPDAPAMIFLLSDHKTIMVLHHNLCSTTQLPLAIRSGLGEDHPGMKDRAQVWVSLSHDGGRTWEPPRFLLSNALAPFESNLFFNYQCSYLDAFTDHGTVHFFLSHRWERVMHLSMPESDLEKLPLEQDLH